MKLDLRQHVPRCEVPLAALSRRLYGRQWLWPAGPSTGAAVLYWQAVQATTAELQLRLLCGDGEWFEVQWIGNLPTEWPHELSHPSLPFPMRDALLVSLIEPVCQRLLQPTSVTGISVEVQVQVQVPAWASHQALGWTLTPVEPTAATALRGMVRAGSAAGWARLESLLPAVLPMAWNRDAQRLTLSVHAPPVPVQRADLRTLAPGDVLLCDANLGAPTRLAARLRLNDQWLPGVRCLYLGHTFQITQTQASGDDRSPDAASPQRKPFMSSSPAAVDALPVWVEVELARVSLSIQQLRGLSVGQMFEIDAGINPTYVNLKCDGQRLGRAELVMVGDRLGVRLVELSALATAMPLPAAANRGVAA